MTVSATQTWQPVRRLGAASPGGLALPAALPTPSQMYAPRGVWTDGRRIVVADTGNHRVLIWHDWPAADGGPADVVLGQPDFSTEGPAAGGRGPERGLNLPTGVGVVGGQLVVADAWHHRLVAYDDLPQTSDVKPVWVLGQRDLTVVEPNAGGEPSLSTLFWPFGFGAVGEVFWVCDTGNRRVLGWHTGSETLPEPGSAADVLLGQETADRRADNRGDDLGARAFRWPHAVTGDAQALYVADAGDHRVLGWTPPPKSDVPADLVLGQQDFDVAAEFKNQPQGAARLRFPYSCVSDHTRLFVADTSNNRVLVWHDRPVQGSGHPADAVLGQPDADSNGENRWDAVADDSFCWPYGLSLAGDVLAVADSGNNRVVVWQLR
ncbi:MAG: hypothetical protein WAN48_10675 [Actinomycetes bacterium]